MDFGAALRQTRERRGVSLREIADATKISARALDALERNDVSRLPGGIFTRAIIRSYAVEIGLDPDQAMRDFLQQFPGEGGGWSPKSDDSFESRRQIAAGVLGILVLAFVTGAVLLFLNLRGGSEPQRLRAAASIAPPPLAAADVPPPSPESADSVGTRGSEVPATPAAETRAEPGTPAEPGTLALTMESSGPCWVSLTVDGRRIFSREMKAGERETAEGAKEAVIGVGNAGNFRLAINGVAARAVGKPGQVVTLRINTQNYQSFLPAR